MFTIIKLLASLEHILRVINCVLLPLQVRTETANAKRNTRCCTLMKANTLNTLRIFNFWGQGGSHFPHNPQCALWDQLANLFAGDFKFTRLYTCTCFVNQGTLYCKLQRYQVYANVATKLLPSYSRMLALSSGPLSASVLVHYLCMNHEFFFVLLAASMTLSSKLAWLADSHQCTWILYIKGERSYPVQGTLASDPMAYIYGTHTQIIGD